MSRGAKTGLLGLLALGALLRFGGMSHDLHEGKVYHPDTPKQINAVKEFYKGRYFLHVGKRFYDGYPLFHAHLVEYIVRAVEPVRRGIIAFVGVPAEKNAMLDTGVLYWVMLALNASLSTATILLVFAAGRENFGPGVAWVAAAFQTVSPIGVTASHTATGDAAAAFFATLSLFYALRIHRRGLRRDYVLASAIGSFAFAAKYYAAMAFFPIAAAHLARVGRLAALFGAASLRRIALAAAAAVAGLFLAIPGLFGHFQAQMQDILTALTKSGQRVPAALGKDPGRWAVFLHGQRVNLPVLFRLLSPALALPAALGFRLRRDARFWILLAGPVAYWVFGVGSRAQVHPIYHTVITAPLFLLIAFSVVALWGAPVRRSRLLRAVTAAGVGVAIAVLAEEALRELFFQWHMDTQRQGSAWAAENVPRSFRADRTRYTFVWESDDLSGAGPSGTLHLRSAVGEFPLPPEEAVPLKRFALERAPLIIFRNIRQEVAVSAPALIRRGFSIPGSQRWPSQSGNQMIFDNGRELIRSEKLVAPIPGERLERWLVAGQPLREAWVVVQVAAAPARVRVSFGGESRRLEIPAEGTAWFRIADPRPQFPSGDGLYYYRFRVEEPTAQVRVLLATRPGEVGRMLFNAGRYADAAPLLERAAREEGEPAAAAQASIAARIAGSGSAGVAATPPGGLVARAMAVDDDDTLFAAYGIRAAYLDALPFLSLPPERLNRAGFRLRPRRLPGESGDDRELALVPRFAEREREKGPRVWTEDLPLDPGHYRAGVALRALRAGGAGGELRAVLVDVRETTTLSDRVFRFPALDTKGYDVVHFDFTVPPGAGAVRLYLKSDRSLSLAIGGLEIRPDIVANARALAATLRAATAADCTAAAGEPLAYDLLHALGARHAGRGDLDEAAGCYAAAVTTVPGRAAALESLQRLLPGLPAERRLAYEAITAKRGVGK